MNLEESEKLIRKAIEEDRKARKKVENLTEGGRQGQRRRTSTASAGCCSSRRSTRRPSSTCEEAVKDKEGQHIEIYDHLAEVYLAAGDKAEAVTTWKKALDLDKVSKRDDDRRVKIEKKLKDAEAK